MSTRTEKTVTGKNPEIHPVLAETYVSELLCPSNEHRPLHSLWEDFKREYPLSSTTGKLWFYNAVTESFGPAISRLEGRAVSAGYFLKVKPN